MAVAVPSTMSPRKFEKKSVSAMSKRAMILDREA